MGDIYQVQRGIGTTKVFILFCFVFWSYLLELRLACCSNGSEPGGYAWVASQHGLLKQVCMWELKLYVLVCDVTHWCILVFNIHMPPHPPPPTHTHSYAGFQNRGQMEKGWKQDGGIEVLVPSCVPVEVTDMPTQELHWPTQLCSPNSCSVFSHIVIGCDAPSIKFSSPRSPTPAPLSRCSIGYCTSTCSRIGHTGWLSRLRGFIHHFATVV